MRKARGVLFLACLALGACGRSVTAPAMCEVVRDPLVATNDTTPVGVFEFSVYIPCAED